MMKKFLKFLPYLIILCCVVFLACTVIKTKERADALIAQVNALTEENTALQGDLAAANAAVAEKDEALIAKEAELTEANDRVEQAEKALNDVLSVVQMIRTELNTVAPEAAPAEEEAPAEEVAEEEAPAEAAEVPAEEEVVTVAPVEEAPAEEVAEEAPVEEAPVEEVPAA